MYPVPRGTVFYTPPLICYTKHMPELFTQKWAIVSLLEDVDESAEFHYAEFPLHVTLAGVFATSKTGQELAAELAELLEDQEPIAIKATRKDLFGPNKNIAVMRIEKRPELLRLHRIIYDWLEKSGVIYNMPEHQGEGYLPHSTFQKSGRLIDGEERLLTSVSLIDLYPNGNGYQRKIAKTIEL